MEHQIAERAKQYALSMYPDLRDEELQSFSDCRRDYAYGAREQTKIVIEKACEWLLEQRILPAYKPPYGFYIEDFKKAMEEYL